MLKDRKYLVLIYGVFHNLSVVEALQRSGNLGFCIGTLPYYYVRKSYQIPRSKYLGLSFLELLRRKRDSPILQYLSAYVFSVVARLVLFVVRCDIMYSTPLIGSRLITRFSGTTVLDRGSTHTCENIRLKNYAYRSQGLPGKYFRNVSVVEREIVEYDCYDKILVPSSFVGESFRKRLIEKDKLIELPYALKSNQRSNLSRLEENVRQQKYFVFVGHATPRKGIYDLVTFWNELSLPFELYLVGNYSEQFNNSKGNIRGLGVINSDNVLDIINKSLGLIMLSYEEGMSLALLEAAACGVPVIGTEETGINELEKLGYPSGIRVERNSASLKFGIDLALKMPKLSKSENPVLSWHWD